MNAQEDIFDLDKKVKRVVAHIDQPELFAALFCNAAKSQKSIDNTLKEILRDLLKDDKRTINLIKKYQREVNNENFKYWGTKIGMLIIGAVLFISGGIATTIVESITKHIFGQ